MKVGDIPNWLRSTMAEREPPPIFEVEPPKLDAESDRKRFGGLNVQFNRRLDSGLLEIRFNGIDSRRMVDLAQTTIAIARDEDRERGFSELRRVHEGSQFLVSRTSIEMLPVLGPGGQVLIQDSEAAFVADITIRKRYAQGMTSEKWIDTELAYRSLAAEFREYPQNVGIQAWLGYYELSKYDHQSFIRPVFMFVVRSHDEDPEKSYIAWETVRLWPATSNKKVTEREGLGVSQ
jgi:hypothetical protein